MVRHGQASYLEDDYDKLSAVGEKQAALLGSAWAHSKHVIDHLYSGPRKRQIRTAEIAADAYHRAGLPWPELTIVEDFDEYQVEPLMRRHMGPLVEKHVHVRELYADYVRTKGTPQAGAAVEDLFRAVTTMWVRQEFDTGESESWLQFEQRVMMALDKVQANLTPDSHAVIFTSAGPSAIAVHSALQLDPVKTLELSWLVRNCACTEFFSNEKQLTLRSFNAVPHTFDSSWITYR
jgi:broad specificity phosphatase PhoE